MPRVKDPLRERPRTEWIQTWLQIGRKNHWIQHAWDPPFTESSFAHCPTPLYLADKLLHGNWCLGAAFYWRNVCFINQIDGGDEWLVIREDTPFESFTCHLIGREQLVKLIRDIHVASNEQCRKLEYERKPSSGASAESCAPSAAN